MKILRVIFIIGIAVCLALLIRDKKEEVVWQDETSQALQMLYSAKKAESVNSRKISVFVGDSEVVSDSSRQQVHMSDDMALMASPLALSKLLGVSVSVVSAGTYEISNGDSTYRFVYGSDNITSKEENFIFPNHTEQSDGKIYFALQAVCLAFEHGYNFELEENIARIVRTDMQQPQLPEQYDMRDDGRAPIVGSQGNLGTCWAFASMAALESTLLPEEHLRFSVDHLSLNNGFNIDQNEGGDYFMALSYLASWKGPVYEADDPYGDFKTDTSLVPVRHLQEAIRIDDKDYETIKRMIYTRGAVQSCFYSDIEMSNVSSEYYNEQTASYFYDGTAEANHDIVIVGWDDHFSRENFNQMPAADGAFLCQNSWGDDFGHNGYFHISYEDTNIGVYNMVYTSLEAPDNYQHIYQSDDLGWLGSIGYNEPGAWLANIYTATAFENLSAVSFYATGSNSIYQVYIVPDYTGEKSLNPDTAIFVESGYLANAGYYTIDLAGDTPVDGPFAVMVYIETKDAVHPVAIEYEGGNLDATVDLTDGKGYISYDGQEWQRVEENYNCNICLKAFTNDIN